MTDSQPSTRLFEAADLRLIMDNYRNLLQMSTILLEQQKQLISFQRESLNKQEHITNMQTAAANELSNISSKIDNCIASLKDTNNEMYILCEKINDNIKSEFKSSNESLSKDKIERTKDHGSITNKIYVGWIGMVSVILTLGTLLVIVYDKYKVVEVLKDNIEKILAYFSIR
jgi:hypothetical protein